MALGHVERHMGGDISVQAEGETTMQLGNSCGVGRTSGSPLVVTESMPGRTRARFRRLASVGNERTECQQQCRRQLEQKREIHAKVCAREQNKCLRGTERPVLVGAEGLRARPPECGKYSSPAAASLGRPDCYLASPGAASQWASGRVGEK